MRKVATSWKVIEEVLWEHAHRAYEALRPPAAKGDVTELEDALGRKLPAGLRASLLIHDAQYTEEEYPSRVGWGHSSIAHTVQFGLLAKVRRLYLFHHDPMHGDDALEEAAPERDDPLRPVFGKEDNRVAFAETGRMQPRRAAARRASS